MPEPARADARENPVFNLLDVGLFALVTIVCTVIAVRFVQSLPAFRGDIKNVTGNALVFIPTQAAAYVLTVGFMVFYILLKYRTGFLKAIQWNMPVPKLAWPGMAGGAVLAVIAEVASGLLHRWYPKSLPMDDLIRTPASGYMLVAFGILVAPLVEELFFRGFLYPALARPIGVLAATVFMPALARPIGVVAATVLTSAGFAMIHSGQLAFAWAPLLILFVVGTTLTVVRAVTKSVAVCVLIHVGYNSTLFTLLFIATRGFHHMERG